MDDQDPAMILAVVRRLHEDQGDTNLHTVIRAARFLDIDIAIDLINEKGVCLFVCFLRLVFIFFRHLFAFSSGW